MKIYFLGFLLTFVLPAFSQAPNWTWARAGGGFDYDQASATVVDTAGNSYVTGGGASATLTFGNVTLLNNNSIFFLAKYSPSGNLLWAKLAGADSRAGGIKISLDNTGDVVLCGSFSGKKLSFGNTIIQNHDTTYFQSDFFIAKFDTSGNIKWMQSGGGRYNDYSTDLSLDVNGNSYLTGFFNDTAIIVGTDTLINHYTSASSCDIFILKFDIAGNLVWARNEGGVRDDVGTGIVTDEYGNAYLTGSFARDSITFGSTTLYSAGSYDFFIAKYDSGGTLIWVRSAGGTKMDDGNQLAIDQHKNLYVAGRFLSPSISFGNVTLLNSDSLGLSSDVFIAKYDSSGNIIWAISGGGLRLDQVGDIEVNDAGEAYLLLNSVSDTVVFGGSFATNSNLPGTTVRMDAFIFKFDTAGNSIWVKRVGGLGFDEAYSVSFAPSGNLFLTGRFGGNYAVFDSDTLYNTLSTTSDFFVAKMDSDFISKINYLTTDLNSFAIFPNPANGFTIISCFEIIDELIISDVLGQMGYRTQPKEKQIRLNMQQKGIYFVTVISAHQRATKKLVIQN